MTWVGDTWWELQLARGWWVENHPECVTITKSDDGALQLSVAVKSNGDITDAEIRDFYQPSIPAGAPFDTVSLGAFSGFCTHFVEDRVHWRKFWLLRGNLLVLVTYNGTADSWRAEGEDVLVMLTSLRISRDG